LPAQLSRDKNTEFLANHAKEPGVKVTASGLQYRVIKAGTGKKRRAKYMEIRNRPENNNGSNQKDDKVNCIFEEIVPGGVHFEFPGGSPQKPTHQETQNTPYNKCDHQDGDYEKKLLPLLVDCLHDSKILWADYIAVD